MTVRIALKRVYDPPSSRDSRRILVDRLWPRGVSKQSARIDVWLKDIAPSNELRTWYHHDPDKWTEFARRYRAELKSKADLLRELRTEAGSRAVTLLFSAKDRERNNAVVLRTSWCRREREAMKRPVVDQDLCIGCGHCVEVCPQVFELEDEKSQVVGPDKCGTCNCQEAIDTCPVQAISWGA